jgi:hypothetical protein
MKRLTKNMTTVGEALLTAISAEVTARAAEERSKSKE